MKLQVVGCNHHNATVEVRERLAFTVPQAEEALEKLRNEFPDTEAVLISTCNRVELYIAHQNASAAPTHEQMAHFLAEFHGLRALDIFDDLFERTGDDAVRHLFTVAASLDSMVLGEAQILGQVKQAYELAEAARATGPLTHAVFQRSFNVAKRVASETAINEKRVSIPSVAVADFARDIFEHFDDKHVLVIGAGEMAEETVRYLKDEGASQITVVNRNAQRAAELAERWEAQADPWDQLDALLAEADLVVSTTGASEAIITAERFAPIQLNRRHQRPLCVLDLAIPRDFDPAIGDVLGVYLYSIDDLEAVCERNRDAREQELERAIAIIEEETASFMADLNHRATSPIIKRLKEDFEKPKEDELNRLLNRLPDLDERSKEEIRRSFDRLVNKLLHPPLESLRDEARSGVPHALMEALKKLFRIVD